MLTYKIIGDTVPVTEELRAYIEKRFDGVERFMDADTPHEILVRLQKTTAHTREDTFLAEASFKLHEREFFAAATGADPMAAIDEVKAELMREVTQSNAKRRTLFHRGGRKIKALLKSGFRRKG